MTLRSPAYRQRTDLLNGEIGFQELWETPSDPRVKRVDGSPPTARSWAVLEASWDVNQHQFVVHVRRLYTRNTGEVREVWGDRIPLKRLSVPASGPRDYDARDRVLAHARAALATMLTPLDGETEVAERVRAVFLARDVTA